LHKMYHHNGHNGHFTFAILHVMLSSTYCGMGNMLMSNMLKEPAVFMK
jgi:hypothetical protein